MATDPWGVTVERVEVKDVRVPEQLMRAMAAEAEAARNARAKVIAAEGEHKASRALSHAAAVIGESPAAMQLRYLQTLRDQAVILHAPSAHGCTQDWEQRNVGFKCEM